MPSIYILAATAQNNKLTESGLSVMRHFNIRKPEKKKSAGVITARMVANAFLCDRGISHNVFLKDEPHIAICIE